MSHPSSPRVSTTSAANVSSQAGDEQASTATADSAGATSNADQAAASGPSAGLLDQAQQWLGNISVPTSLPAPLKRLGSQASSGWGKLSTTQKVLGGALLAAGGWYLLRPGKMASRRRAASPASTLHELLLFVNDRIEGYRRAASESQDADRRNYYQQLVDQSQQFAQRLNGYLRTQDSGEETGTTLKGKLYRAWMEAKAAVTGYSEEAVLGSNVYGEEWALAAYEEALDDRRVTGSLRREIERQYEQSRQTYNRLKQLQEQEQH